MTKKNLVILNGWGMPSIVWYKMTNLLSKDFSLIVISWNEADSLLYFKEKVEKILLEHKVSSFSLLGWSLGSLVAQEISKDIRFNVSNMILIGGTSSFIQHKDDSYQIGWNKRILEKMKLDILNKGSDKTLIKFSTSMLSEVEIYKGYNSTLLEYIREHLIETPPHSLITGLEYLIQTDLRYNLADLHLPILLIHGEDDIICPLEAGIYINSNAINSKINILKNTGHIPFLTNPVDCYNAIYEFIYEEKSHD